MCAFIQFCLEIVRFCVIFLFSLLHGSMFCCCCCCCCLPRFFVYNYLTLSFSNYSVLNCRGIGIEIYSVIFDVDKFERTAVSQAVVAMTLYAEILQMSAIMTNFGFIRFISLIVSHLYTAK